MKRIRLSSSVFTMVGLLVSVGPVSLAAQNARPHGEAATEGHAVPRDRTERATQSEARAPQGESRRPEPARDEATTTRVPPSRRVEVPNATVVARPTPRVIVPGVVVPRVVQPQVARSQGETVRPNDHPAYRPDYRPNYRPQYEPNYRPLDRPDYHRSYRPYYTFRPRLLLGFGLWGRLPGDVPGVLLPLRS